MPGARSCFLLALLASAGAAARAQTGFQPAIQALSALIDHEVSGHKLPSVSVALIDDQTLVWTHRSGAEESQPVFRAGPVSQLFTAVGIMQLVERGDVALDQPVSQYLPEFHPRNPYRRQITLRQLLSHHSGLAREPPVGSSFDAGSPSLSATVESLNASELLYAPRTHFKYSNAGIAVAGLLLEKLAKRPFAEYMQQNVLGPMGMNSSSFAPSPELSRGLIKGSMWAYDGRALPAPTFALGIGPAANLLSTVTDLGQFLSMLFARGRGSKGVVLKSESIEQMCTPQFEPPHSSTGFGLGFRVGRLGSHRLVEQGGSVYGFSTNLAALPDDKLGIVVFSDMDSVNGVTYRIATEGLKMMLAAKEHRPVVAPATPSAMREINGRDFPKPPAPPEAWRNLIGEYGPDYNTLFIHERDGKLTALIDWFEFAPLTSISPNVFRFPESGRYDHETLTFTRDASGRATRVSISGVVLARRNVAPEDGATFRIVPVRPVAELREEALRATPPVESPDLLKPDLVELTKLDPAIHLDIRYASTNNFMSAAFYPAPRAFLQRPAAEALVRANSELKQLGFGLLIHDGYRPWYVTKMFWDATPPDKHIFVADPSEGSKHNRGCAVDLTLYDLKTGAPIEMTGGYDEMSDRSYPDYPGGTSLQRWHRHLLRTVIEKQGFTVNEAEWWHFDFYDWKRYPILNLDFSRL